MPIPLTGVPAPADPVKLRELLRGDSSNFDAGLGNWTASAGTLTRDTSFKFRRKFSGSVTYYGGSLQHVTTAVSQYVECPVPAPVGGFKAGECYTALVVLNSPTDAFSVNVALGDIANTDSDVNIWTPCIGTSTDTSWALGFVQWIPAANRTSAVIRLTRANGAGSITMRIGLVSVNQGAAPVLAIQNPAGSSERLVPEGIEYTRGQYDRVALRRSTFQSYLDQYWSGITLYGAIGNAAEKTIYMYAEGQAAGTRKTSYEFDVGTDYLELHWGEKASDEVEMWPNQDSYTTLLDGNTSGATKHWQHATPDGVRSRLGAWFEQVFRISGALSVATNVAAYWQAPYNLRIDEVRCHVGTAPTGAAILVDVNDDGTTVFTTQGNRPSIAAAGTDATSGAADGGTSVVKDSVMTIDVDQIGSGTAGSDLYVSIRGRYIW